jgi:hypothetical protein
MKILFGKYKGTEIEELPSEYINWLVSLDDLREPLRSAIDREIARRERSDIVSDILQMPKFIPSHELKPLIKEIIDAGFHQVAFRYHPDKGGATKKMQMLSMARAWLYKFVLGGER